MLKYSHITSVELSLTGNNLLSIMFARIVCVTVHAKFIGVNALLYLNYFIFQIITIRTFSYFTHQPGK